MDPEHEAAFFVEQPEVTFDEQRALTFVEQEALILEEHGMLILEEQGVALDEQPDADSTDPQLTKFFSDIGYFLSKSYDCIISLLKIIQ